jgi:hypothetical protein
VTTTGGTATSVLSFTGIRPPGIPTFIPSEAAAGSTITVNGANVGFATSVTFTGGAQQTSLTTLTPNSIRLVVPAGAATGPVTVTTPAGPATSLVSFTVPFVVESFAPTVAAAGGGVTLNGTSFFNASLVDFNGAPALFQALADDQIIALVPPTATDGPITVTDFLGETAVSTASFAVIRQTGFSPAIAPVGHDVTITGQHLDAVQEVDFNGTPAASFVVNGAGTSLTTQVPAGATDGPIQLLDAADGSADSASAFHVISVDDFFPSSGSPGTAVALLGSHFENATAVKFGTVSTSAFAVHSSGKLLAVSVPPGAETGQISVVTPDGTATSAGTFTVLP